MIGRCMEYVSLKQSLCQEAPWMTAQKYIGAALQGGSGSFNL